MTKNKISKVIVIGAAGRMGKTLIQMLAREEDEMRLSGAIEHSENSQVGLDAGEIAGIGKIGIEITDDLSSIIEASDVLIEFSSPVATVENLRRAVKFGKPIVIGTTGYSDEQLLEIQELGKQVPCLMAPNMSVGVNLLLKAVELVAKTIGNDYDIEIIETHHNQKKDAPSGTALKIAEVAANALDRDLQEVAVHGRSGLIGKRTKKEIGIHAVRAGNVVGEHSIIFAGNGEYVELKHHAQSREAFAGGAIRAARWLIDAPKGLHNINNVFTDDA